MKCHKDFGCRYSRGFCWAVAHYGEIHRNPTKFPVDAKKSQNRRVFCAAPRATNPLRITGVVEVMPRKCTLWGTFFTHQKVHLVSESERFGTWKWFPRGRGYRSIQNPSNFQVPAVGFFRGCRGVWRWLFVFIFYAERSQVSRHFTPAGLELLHDHVDPNGVPIFPVESPGGPAAKPAARRPGQTPPRKTKLLTKSRLVWTPATHGQLTPWSLARGCEISQKSQDVQVFISCFSERGGNVES